jgi:hypothetical protein
MTPGFGLNVVPNLAMCVVARKFSSAVTLAQACIACGFKNNGCINLLSV